MKHLIFAFFTLHFSLFILTAFAGVPVPWTVDMRRAQPSTFEAYQGETLDFQASLTLDGKPFEAPLNYSFFWQTNGMGRYYWEKKVEVGSRSRTEEFDNSIVGLRASTSTNVLFATWTPEMDVGAKVYNCFIGSPSNNYHTAFQLRLRPSPGATPNVLPLPVPVIDFAKVRVLNPPWSGGGGGGVDTNAVRDIVRPMIADATNGIRSVDGAARPLPKYLHLYETADSYPESAEEYYRFRDAEKTIGGCSSVRSGGFLYRNFDFPFDDRAEFVVKMSAGKGRFASVGVAQVGTNLTEQIVTSGKPASSRLYKWLPGATVDGINENGVACNINVVDGDPQTSGWLTTGDIHPLAAIRWALDNATNALHAASNLAKRVKFPAGWVQNFHYMIADERDTYIVENGEAYPVPPPSSAAGASAALTNFRLYPTPSDGEGQERYVALTNGANITSQWWTLTYTANGYRPSDLPGITGQSLTNLFNYWASKPREAHRGESFDGQPWWQSIHTSVYDLTNRTLRVAVQEVDDWYVFQVPSSGAKVDAYTKAETDGLLAGKLDGPTVAPSTDESAGGKAADAKATGEALAEKLPASWKDDVSSTFAGTSEIANRANSAFSAEFAEGAVNAQNANMSARAGSLEDEFYANINITQGNGGRWVVHDLFHPDGFNLLPVDGKLDAPAASSVTNGHVAVFKKVTNPDNTVTVKVEDGGTKISHTDPTFTNAVIQTMKGVTPQPSPELRLWDPVLNRWVILKSVNMNITLEVE